MTLGDWDQTAQYGTGNSGIESEIAMSVDKNNKSVTSKVTSVHVRKLLHRALRITGVPSMRHSMGITSIRHNTDTV